MLVALTEAERLGLIGFAGVLVTAAASLTAAVLAHRVRQENAQQHGTSQELLSTLATKVDDHGHKLDQVADRVEGVAARVDHAHARLDSHKGPRRWFK